LKAVVDYIYTDETPDVHGKGVAVGYNLPHLHPLEIFENNSLDVC